MRCSRAVKGEGKKPKFGECVRARERGESFTRSVHARRAKAGAFLDLAGEKRAKVGRCFVFPRVLLSFNRSVISRCGALGGIGVRDGNRFALWSMGCGCSEYSAVRRKTQRATLHNGVARCLVAVRSFLCFLLTPERKLPCFLLSYGNLLRFRQKIVSDRL